VEEKSLEKSKENREADELLITRITKEIAEMQDFIRFSKDYSDKLEEILRREAIYKSQIERLPSSREPVEEFLVQRTEKLSMLSTMRSQKLLMAEKDRAEQEIYILEAEIARKKESLNLLETEKAMVALSEEVERGFNRYNELSESLGIFESLQIKYQSSVNILLSKIDILKKCIEKTEKIREYREQVKNKATNASNASIILNQVENEIASRIVPSIEGTLTEILSVMSGGRFRDLKVTNDYEVLINEEGEYRPISEFSGGEQDLASLAMRLALANVIKDHNGGGVEFIILDECLGSQDHQRRETILNGLRNLKSIYKQIFLISHIPGIDDAVDRVIDVTNDESTINEMEINEMKGGENG
jgi:DNA repair exonuclease SbcCD ATPase subunit